MYLSEITELINYVRIIAKNRPKSLKDLDTLENIAKNYATKPCDLEEIDSIIDDLNEELQYNDEGFLQDYEDEIYSLIAGIYELFTIWEAVSKLKKCDVIE